MASSFLFLALALPAWLVLPPLHTSHIIELPLFVLCSSNLLNVILILAPLGCQLTDSHVLGPIPFISVWPFSYSLQAYTEDQSELEIEYHFT